MTCAKESHVIRGTRVPFGPSEPRLPLIVTSESSWESAPHTPNETALTRHASMTVGMIIGRRRIFRPTQPPTVRRMTCCS